VGLFTGMNERRSSLLDYDAPTSILRDNLYLLLNRDKIPKLLMIRTISPWPEPNMQTEAVGEPVAREKEKPNASRNEVLSSGKAT